jgi:hypothetical protein
LPVKGGFRGILDLIIKIMLSAKISGIRGRFFPALNFLNSQFINYFTGKAGSVFPLWELTAC